MIEQIECMGDPLDGEAAVPCRFYNVKCRDENHRTQIVLHPVHWAFREGVVSTHLVRITKELKRNMERAAANRTVVNCTGMVYAKVAETDTFENMFNDPEQAAYRIGGMDAVRALRKSQQPPRPRKSRAKPHKE